MVEMQGARNEMVPDQFEELLAMLGRLNYVWTNTESVLIHMIAGLARTDTETGTMIFLTLNTTRARLSLVERLAKLTRVDTKVRDAVLSLTRRLARASSLRNRLNHCIYAFDEGARTAHTIQMRVQDSAKSVRFGKVSTVDKTLLDRVATSLVDLRNINIALWDLVEQNNFPR